jgi:LacI family transcriptional regulator
MPVRPHVALLIETSNSYARGLLRGIHRYLREHRPWTIDLPEQGRGAPPPLHLARWRGDGIIARIENARIAEAVRQAGLPTIDVSAARLLPELPVVETDNEAIMRLAVGHLRAAGFKQFAFCGDERFVWSRLRRSWFERIVADFGFPMSSYPHTAGRRAPSWEQERASLADWLGGLPKPVGIIACYDQRGWQVLEVCRGIGVGVPDQVAVIGVDNDELLCELAHPSLSSVIPDTDRTGYAAAELLGQMMAGHRVEAKEYLIGPLGIAPASRPTCCRGPTPTFRGPCGLFAIMPVTGSRSRRWSTNWPCRGGCWNIVSAGFWATPRTTKSCACRSSAWRSFWPKPICRWRRSPTGRASSTPNT